MKFRAFRRAADCRHQGIACETGDRERFEARDPDAIPAAGGGTNWGNCTTRGFDTPATRRQQASCSAKPPSLPMRRAAEGPEGQAAVPVGAGGTGGHGRAAKRGAWPRCRWAVAGPGRASRSTTPSRRLACGDLAGGPPPTGTHSGPAHQGKPHGGRNTSGRAAAHGHIEQPGTLAAPETPAGHKQQARIQKRPPGTGWAYLSRLWESNPRPIHYE